MQSFEPKSEPVQVTPTKAPITEAIRRNFFANVSPEELAKLKADPLHAAKQEAAAGSFFGPNGLAGFRAQLTPEAMEQSKERAAAKLFGDRPRRVMRSIDETIRLATEAVNDPGCPLPTFAQFQALGGPADEPTTIEPAAPCDVPVAPTYDELLARVVASNEMLIAVTEVNTSAVGRLASVENHLAAMNKLHGATLAANTSLLGQLGALLEENNRLRRAAAAEGESWRLGPDEDAPGDPE